MKRKNLNCVLIIVSIILLGSFLFLILGFFGFRIIYNPCLNIDWNAMGVLGNWFLVAIAIVTLYFAIRIPQQERIESSKIDLFQHRFGIFYEIKRHLMDGEYAKKLEGEKAEEYNELLEKVRFLVDKEDWEKINSFAEKTTTLDHKESIVSEETNKISIYFEMRLPYEELQELEKIFNKYLYLGEYGLNK